MSDSAPGSERSRPARPQEQEAVRTTIVGGRPPGSGTSVGPIPRGVEVLVKKASVDPEFRQVLLSQRARAAERIGLVLTPAEAAMLAAVPAGQLEAIIDQTHVPDETRRTFLGTAAAAMLAALGISVSGCVVVTGSRPNDKPTTQPTSAPAGQPSTQPATQPGPPTPSAGVRAQPPDNERPPVVILGVRVETRPTTLPMRSAGVRADLPPGAKSSSTEKGAP